MPLNLVITDAGRAALVNAANDGTRAVRIATAGVSPTATAPTPATSTLPGEVKRIATLSGDQVAADVIHLVIQDESADTYPLRSFALYLADGTLFALYGQELPIIEKSAQALLLLAIDVQLADINADTITFGNADFIIPPATIDRRGVIEIATEAEAATLTDTARALTPKGLAVVFTAANILARLLQVDGAGSGLDADLLDGRDGGYYADVVARLGFTPVNAVSYNGYEILAKLMGNDGAGSGLDADLLDGREGAYYADVLARLGFVPLAASAYTAADIIAKLLGVDGSGSGLDADLLDGRDGAYYADVLARLGYTPVNAVSYNGYEILAKLMANDGAGSGLDADLLDGREGAYYADVLARLGFTPLAASAYTAADIRTKLLTVDGAGSGVDADLLDGRQAAEFALLTGASFTGDVRTTGRAVSAKGMRAAGPADDPGDVGTGVEVSFVGGTGYVISIDRSSGQSQPLVLSCSVLRRNDATIMDSGNDGAGSGFDADLLDGRHAAEFSRVTAFNSAANGHRIHDDGYKECWGSVYIAARSSVVVQLPVAHTAWCVPVGNGWIDQDEASIGIVGVNGNPPESFTVRNKNPMPTTFYWHTRGV